MEPLPKVLHGRKALFVVPLYVGPVEEGERALAPLRGGGRPLADAIAPIPYLAFQQQLDAIAPHGAHGWSRACLRVLGVPLALACLVAVALTSLGACGRTAPGTPTGASLPAPPSFLPTPPAFPTGPFVAMTVSTFLRHGYTRPGDLCDADLVAVAAVARYGGAH